MISETRMAYGSVVRRQGRSRALWRYQERSERRNDEATAGSTLMEENVERPTPNVQRPISGPSIRYWTLGVRRWTFAPSWIDDFLHPRPHDGTSCEASWFAARSQL